MSLQPKTFEETEAFYKQYQGPFDKPLFTAFDKVMKDRDLIKKDEKKYEYRCGNAFGIYHDDPDVVKDQDKLRAEIGFLFDTKALSDEERKELVKEYGKKGYSYAKFRNTRTYYENFPIRSPIVLSFLIGGKKFYPLVKQKLKDENVLSKLEGSEYGFVETYTDSEINFFAPTENFEDFYLTSHPTPEPK
eukprot:CAMPEP_0205823820 /NCGR_PEP_ID=MMETSP0206-20130828/18015_1 /ASSEMBLY_ACC=CAM_ASM_000279 /TAXON_ID=36767 /ORGANISM="Euplotes focardii, Strain TN1" /LENGTH=189 /DNA_ID=CAMNT_0053121317 /DNA_START=86 /DNA_END=655 /DNA_ORIENTATION=+